MKVKNIVGTEDNNCSCGSWLEHWLTYSGNKSLPGFCSEISCTNKPEVGAHIIKVGSTDSDWYIVPLCKAHNKKSDEFEIVKINLALASKKKTCG
ncbi:hypothetical protein [Photorhabdus akhurstii]|uniref:hypothetical protein n=1 Tax=Photorhabdus akhurstii TaxID=171438 RepID=UPI001BD2BAB3|nr:hypothetical protein [Photorhabdus akhurstii]